MMVKHWKFTLASFVIFSLITGGLVVYFRPSIQALAQKPTPDQFENEEEALAEKKEITENNINAMTSYLGEVKVVVAKFNALTASDRTEILEEIGTYESWLVTQKEAALNETSLDDIKTLDSEISSYWDNVFVRAIFWNGELMQAKLERMYEQLENIINNLDSEIRKANKQSSSAAQSLTLAREKLKVIADKKNQSRDKFGEISDKNTASVIFTQGKQYLREAKVFCSELKKELLDTIYYIEN